MKLVLVIEEWPLVKPTFYVKIVRSISLATLNFKKWGGSEPLEILDIQLSKSFYETRTKKIQRALQLTCVSIKGGYFFMCSILPEG